MSADGLTPGVLRSLQGVAQRELSTAVLLFVAGHRPLAWLGAQALHLSAPWADLLGMAGWAEWATLLEQPDGLQRIEDALRQSAAPSAADSA